MLKLTFDFFPPSFIAGRVRFLRDRSSGYYGTVPYYVSKFVVDAVALRIVPVIVFVLISYPLIGFEHRFNSTYVNTQKFRNASACSGEKKYVSVYMIDFVKDCPHVVQYRLTLCVVLFVVSLFLFAGGIVQHHGKCVQDPLANTSDDGGAWGRSQGLVMLMLSMTAVAASAVSSVVAAISTNGKVGNFATVLVILVRNILIVIL